MAQNLRAKIAKGDNFTIFDVNKSAVDRFIKESENANVKAAETPREVVEQSVSKTRSHTALHDEPFCSIDDLSWGLRPFS